MTDTAEKNVQQQDTSQQRISSPVMNVQNPVSGARPPVTTVVAVTPKGPLRRAFERAVATIVLGANLLTLAGSYQLTSQHYKDNQAKVPTATDALADSITAPVKLFREWTNTQQKEPATFYGQLAKAVDARLEENAGKVGKASSTFARTATGVVIGTIDLPASMVGAGGCALITYMDRKDGGVPAPGQ